MNVIHMLKWKLYVCLVRWDHVKHHFNMQVFLVHACWSWWYTCPIWYQWLVIWLECLMSYSSHVIHMWFKKYVIWITVCEMKCKSYKKHMCDFIVHTTARDTVRSRLYVARRTDTQVCRPATCRVLRDASTTWIRTHFS